MDLRKPSAAFVAASWSALGLGMGAFVLGLWNATMALNEKGYYFAVLMYGLFSAVSVQKSVRDRAEGIPVTVVYYGLSWFSILLALSLRVVGQFNADSLSQSEKGFYGMTFALSLFAAVTVQKNTRDLTQLNEADA